MHSNSSNINLFADIFNNSSPNQNKTIFESHTSQNENFLELIDNLLQEQESVLQKENLPSISGGNKYVEDFSNLEDKQSLQFFNLIKNSSYKISDHMELTQFDHDTHSSENSSVEGIINSFFSVTENNSHSKALLQNIEDENAFVKYKNFLESLPQNEERFVQARIESNSSNNISKQDIVENRSLYEEDQDSQEDITSQAAYNQIDTLLSEIANLDDSSKGIETDFVKARVLEVKDLFQALQNNKEKAVQPGTESDINSNIFDKDGVENNSLYKEDQKLQDDIQPPYNQEVYHKIDALLSELTNFDSSKGIETDFVKARVLEVKDLFQALQNKQGKESQSGIVSESNENISESANTTQSEHNQLRYSQIDNLLSELTNFDSFNDLEANLVKEKVLEVKDLFQSLQNNQGNGLRSEIESEISGNISDKNIVENKLLYGQAQKVSGHVTEAEYNQPEYNQPEYNQIDTLLSELTNFNSSKELEADFVKEKVLEVKSLFQSLQNKQGNTDLRSGIEEDVSSNILDKDVVASRSLYGQDQKVSGHVTEAEHSQAEYNQPEYNQIDTLLSELTNFNNSKELETDFVKDKVLEVKDLLQSLQDNKELSLNDSENISYINNVKKDYIKEKLLEINELFKDIKNIYKNKINENASSNTLEGLSDTQVINEVDQKVNNLNLILGDDKNINQTTQDTYSEKIIDNLYDLFFNKSSDQDISDLSNYMIDNQDDTILTEKEVFSFDNKADGILTFLKDLKDTLNQSNRLEDLSTQDLSSVSKLFYSSENDIENIVDLGQSELPSINDRVQSNNIAPVLTINKENKVNEDFSVNNIEKDAFALSSQNSRKSDGVENSNQFTIDDIAEYINERLGSDSPDTLQSLDDLKKYINSIKITNSVSDNISEQDFAVKQETIEKIEALYAKLESSINNNQKVISDNVLESLQNNVALQDHTKLSNSKESTFNKIDVESEVIQNDKTNIIKNKSDNDLNFNDQRSNSNSNDKYKASHGKENNITQENSSINSQEIAKDILQSTNADSLSSLDDETFENDISKKLSKDSNSRQVKIDNSQPKLQIDTESDSAFLNQFKDSFSGASLSNSSKSEVSSLPSYVLNQVTQKIIRGFNNNRQIQIHLKPENLGRLRIDIEGSKKALKVTIISEYQASKDILSSHVADLKSALMQQGINIENIDVQVSSNFEQSMSQTGQHFNGNSNQNRNRSGLQRSDSKTVNNVNPDIISIINPESNSLDLLA